MKRTTGVRIFALIIMVILVCQFIIIFSNPDYMLPQNIFTWEKEHFSENWFKSLFIIAIFILSPSIVGIFLLKNWGRIIAIWAALLLLLNMLGQLIIWPNGLYYYGILSLILCSFIDIIAPFMLYYLTRPKVKEQFK